MAPFLLPRRGRHFTGRLFKSKSPAIRSWICARGAKGWCGLMAIAWDGFGTSAPPRPLTRPAAGCGAVKMKSSFLICWVRNNPSWPVSKRQSSTNCTPKRISPLPRAGRETEMEHACPRGRRCAKPAGAGYEIRYTGKGSLFWAGNPFAIRRETLRGDGRIGFIQRRRPTVEPRRLALRLRGQQRAAPERRLGGKG